MEALYDGLSLDFPCVNPQVYSRKARFVFFTAAGAAEHVSAPLQAGVPLSFSIPHKRGLIA